MWSNLAAFSSAVRGVTTCVDSSKSLCPVLLACNSRSAMLTKIFPHSLHLYDVALAVPVAVAVAAPPVAISGMGSSMSSSSWCSMSHSIADSSVFPDEYNSPFWARIMENPISSVRLLMASGSRSSTGFFLSVAILPTASVVASVMASSSSLTSSFPSSVEIAASAAAAAAGLESSVSIGATKSVAVAVAVVAEPPPPPSLANRRALASAAVCDPPRVFPPTSGMDTDTPALSA
mmetsp:Transcript_4254/g.8786  ORF Transcript_4254/g.8786 Transcript_4254/m.8786 type:complete len:234 (+) Transcript_4254:991-1692(+)